MHLNRNSYRLIAIAAVFGGLAVGSGAFGAHALKNRLLAAGTNGVWETAVFYHLIHAVAALAVGLGGGAVSTRVAGTLIRTGWCWLAGVTLFSGSLYALALGGPRFMGPITPVGGLFLLAGWVMLAWAAWRQSLPSASK
ncbi:MAG: DUF423 domain-containing protein [Verrucomicrobiota bacterium]